MTYEYPPELRQALIEAKTRISELRARVFDLETKVNVLYSQVRRLQATQEDLLKRLRAMEDIVGSTWA